MSWTPNIPIPGQQSKGTPALASYGDLLHLVHQGESSNDLWHSWYDGAAWRPNERIVDQQSKGAPTLATYGGRLHLVHQGDSENQLWHSTWDGERWSANAKIPGEKAHSPVAMAELGGRLHLVHNGDSSNRLYHLTWDGRSWTQLMQIPDQLSKGAPALAVHHGVLHLVHQGDSENQLWHSTFDGTSWTPNVKIPEQLSKSAPALAVTNDLLQLVHLGDSSNRIWHSTSDGASWAPNVPVPHQLAEEAPALGSLGPRLHMVHTGDSEDTLWHSSSDGVLVNRPTRRVVVIDLDGVRWESFYRHLRRVKQAGASTETTYRFQLPPGASDDTVLGDGDVDLHSALAELCFGGDNGMVDVRLALSSYPTFTFPTHATMYTGVWPRRHGICGHKFVVRDAPPEWDHHQWDALPRALSLQGYCTDAEGSWGAFWDHVWGGFDQVSEGDCRNRNRGLNSDLRVDTLFHRVEDAGKRSTAVNAFYHGARRPWEHYGKDQWWHYDSVELRSVKDICSDEDLDQLEVADSAAFAKAEVAVSFMPSTVSVTPPDSLLARSVALAFTRRDGVAARGWTVEGEPHPDGPPDLMAVYVASADESSHKAGPRQQETYLAWFDHRLARFVTVLRLADPDVFANTVFAFVADHGHRAIANPPSTPDLSSDNVLLVREELMRIRFGDAETSRVRQVAEGARLSVTSVYADVLADQVKAWAEAMNLYVYLRAGSGLDTVDVARRLLSIPMNTEPYGALVLVEGRYRFLARGEAEPVPVNSPAARAVIVPRLDPPPVSTEDIEAVALDDGSDPVDERRLREQLNTPAVFALLGIPRRVAGFNATEHSSMPDVVLLAPEGRSFTSSPSTHGSFAYPTSRIPMVFCGPGMPAGRRTLETADLVDFAPTVLSLLGVPSEGMDGRPLVDHEGRPTPVLTAPEPPGEAEPAVDAAAAGGAPPRPARHPSREKRALPAARVVGRPARTRRATDAELAGTLPTYVAANLVRDPRAAVGSEAPDAGRHPARRLTVDPTGWVRLDEVRVVAAPGARLWVTGTGSSATNERRLPLGRRRTLDLTEHGTVELGSSDSRGTIRVPRELLLVPIEVTLPELPGWLRSLAITLRKQSRLGLELDAEGRPVLLTGEDFTELVAGLARQLDPTADPEPQPPIFEAVRAPASHAAVLEAAQRLRGLLPARQVTRFALADGGLLG
jgi:hypothetical protein